MLPATHDRVRSRAPAASRSHPTRAATIPGMNTHATADVRPRDPVCGMAVRPDVAVEDGLVADHEGHTYYFCRQGCLEQFTADPAKFIASHSHSAEAAASAGPPEIDDGLRLWYESCSCCLSDAYPDVKAALDAERDAKSQPQPGAGICEIAEAGPPPS